MIEVALDLDGYPVTVIDTAGIRETDDPVEQEGVRRAKASASEADLVLWLIDAQNPLAPAAAVAPVWLVRNKVDLDAVRSGNGTAPHKVMADFQISAHRGDGIAQLIAALVGFARSVFRIRGGRSDHPDAPAAMAAGCRRFAATQLVSVRARNWPPRNCARLHSVLDGCWAGSMSRISWT